MSPPPTKPFPSPSTSTSTTTTSSLTTHLLHHARTHTPQSTHLKLATQHPFLRASGNGSLPLATLEHWLAQDIHYTRAYIRFLGGVLAGLRLGTRVYVERNGQEGDGEDEKEMTLGFRILGLLVFALNNVQREMKFFEDVCRKYNIALPSADELSTKTVFTRAYTDLLDSVGARASSGSGDEGSGGEEGMAALLVALVVLWGTEWCYLNAWRFARDVGNGKGISGLEGEEAEKEKGGAGANTNANEAANEALQQHFIPNWSSEEFEEFVERCRGLVDEVAERERGNGSEDRVTRLRNGAEETFAQVLWIESGFWPDV